MITMSMYTQIFFFRKDYPMICFPQHFLACFVCAAIPPNLMIVSAGFPGIRDFGEDLVVVG